MDIHTQKIRRAWEERQKKLGSNHRSVLFKNLPSWMNESLHHRHSGFIIHHLPQQAKILLDVGCGFGRLAHEIMKAKPEIKINGIELCPAFAQQFETEFSGCFQGSMQDYNPDQTFDAILIVTVLMYAKHEDILNLLQKFWSALVVGGRLICIEPYENILIRLIRQISNHLLQPTCGQVVYFQRHELESLLNALPAANMVGRCAFSLMPWFNFPVLHHGFVLQKTA